jgi:flagellar basal-body rod modification protein FlgD
LSTAANAATAPSRNPKSVLGKDEFLKLLVAQLKNQDPTNPMDGQQMAAQLAQFSSVEQLIAINEKLATQATTDSATATAISNSTALNAIGKTVSALGNQIELGGDDEARVRAVVQGTGRGTIRLTDANGTVVATRDLGTVRAGDQQFALGDMTAGLAAGTYNWTLDVRTAQGATVPVTPFITGRVSGVEYGPGGAMLVAGRLRIPIGTVVSLGTPQPVPLPLRPALP